MKLKFKWLSGLLLFWGIIQLQAQPIGLRLPDTTGVQGQYIDYPVYVDSSLTGHGVVSYQIQFTFNASYIRPDSVFSTGTLTQSLGNFTANLNQSGKITIAAAGTTPLIGSGKLIYIRFKMLRTGYAYTTFSGVDNNYLNEGVPEVLLDNGWINMSAQPSINVYPDNGNITIGETKDFNVSGATNPITWSLSDPSVGTINSDGTVTATWYGSTQVIAEDALGIIDTTTGFLEVRAFKQIFPDTSVFQGNMLEVPIRITDLAALNITAGSFGLDYNQNYLKVVGINTLGTVLDGVANVAYNSVPGYTTIAFASDTPLGTGNKLIYVLFEAMPSISGYAYVNIEDAIMNQDLAGNVDNGYINIQSLASLIISPGSGNLLAGETLQFSISNGTVPYTWISTNPGVAAINSNGILTALSGGITRVEATDALGAYGITGNVQVHDTWTDIPDTSAPLATELNVPVRLGNFSSSIDVFSVQAEITYDTSRITAMDIIQTGTLTNGWALSKNLDGNKVRVAGAASTPFSSGGDLFLIRFLVKPSATPGHTAYITYNELLMNEGSPSARLSNGSIIIGAGALPTKVMLASPDSGTVDVPMIVSYNWHPADFAAMYDLQVDTLPDFSSPVVNIINISDTTYSIAMEYHTMYYWRVRATNGSGAGPWSNIWTFQTLVNNIVEPVTGIKPTEYMLQQNYPNPFNPSTTIQFSLPKSSQISLAVYNSLGELVELLLDGYLVNGVYRVQWQAGDLPSGVYFYTLRSGNFRQMKKMMLVK